MAEAERLRTPSHAERQADGDRQPAAETVDPTPVPPHPPVRSATRAPVAVRPALIARLATPLGNQHAQRLIQAWRTLPLQRQDDPNYTPGPAPEPTSSPVFASEKVRAKVDEIEQTYKDDPAEQKGDLAYYSKILPAILSVASDKGIPLKNAILIMAQAQAEHGKGFPPGNMIFGITTNWTDPTKVIRVNTWEVVEGKRVERPGARFRRYDTPEASVEAYLDLLRGQDPEFTNMYPGGVPYKVLQDPNASPTAFLEAMIKGGYSTNPNGYDVEITNKDGTKKKVHVPGYREQYPKLVNQIKGELKTMLPQVVARSKAAIDRLQAKIEALRALGSDLAASIERSSDDPEDEKVRTDLQTLAALIKRLQEQLTKLKEKQAKLEEFQKAFGPGAG